VPLETQSLGVPNVNVGIGQIIDDNYADFLARFEAEGRSLSRFLRREFEDYLKCGRLEHGFLRVRCTGCHAEKLVAFSYKRRGFCPSCGARRMVESAALLIDEALPAVPMHQRRYPAAATIPSAPAIPHAASHSQFSRYSPLAKCPLETNTGGSYEATDFGRHLVPQGKRKAQLK
jgi:ribosomal protein S27E